MPLQSVNVEKRGLNEWVTTRDAQLIMPKWLYKHKTVLLKLPLSQLTVLPREEKTKRKKKKWWARAKNGVLKAHWLQCCAPAHPESSQGTSAVPLLTLLTRPCHLSSGSSQDHSCEALHITSCTSTVLSPDFLAPSLYQNIPGIPCSIFSRIFKRMWLFFLIILRKNPKTN